MSKNKEEMVDVEVNLGEALAKEIRGLSKQELLNRFVVLCLRNKVQDQTVERLEKINEELEGELDSKKGAIQQARNMILSIMGAW